MRTLVVRLFREDRGQDLIEYALLTGFIALAAIAAVNLLGLTLNAAYVGWDTTTQGLWEPPPP